MALVKSPLEIEGMRRAGRVLFGIAERLRGKITVGISTEEIDRIAEGLIFEAGAKPAFKGYRGFPATICASINEEVVHGIPSSRRLEDGDLFKLDIGISLNGYFSDCAFTVGVGNINSRLSRLLEGTKKALELGIAQAKPSNQLYDISWAIQSYIEEQGFSIVRDFVGHGIGLSMHEEPEVPNFGAPHTGLILTEGMVLAIEPMVNFGSWEVKIAENGWTAVTKDNLESAHFEHTVLITKDGPEILTKNG